MPDAGGGAYSIKAGVRDEAAADVCLVTMPYCPIARPSLALGLLKACLREAGISCAVEYANLRFADLVGLETLRVIATSFSEHLIGDWTFSNAAFPEHRTAAADVIGRRNLEELSRQRPDRAVRLDAMLEVWNAARDLAPAFVDETARRVLARGPRIVGCTSTFEQQTASLALLRRVKALDPTVVTMLGGANCEAEMGWGVIREFPWVDFVVSGEAEELFAPLCRLLLEGGIAVEPRLLPHGVLGAAHVAQGSYGPGRASAPRAVVERLDQVPIPDFDDYFSALARSEVRASILPALPIETSRGCWWGQKSQCTFCGLNGEGMRYRSKRHGRVLDEMEQLATRYGINNFQVADNILDMQHLRTVLPALARAGSPYELFYEIKANLRREQVATLAAAGVTKVQPGIEALHDGLLKLMAKGSTAAINISLLRHMREVGINSVWLMLVGFPGEQDAWHAEVASWLPLISHLQPPADVVRVRIDRFSVYHQDPARYGLDLRPFPSYQAVYPSTPERLADLAYFFRDENTADARTDAPGVASLRRAVAEWIRAFGKGLRPILCARDCGDTIEFIDTRPVAVARRFTLSGLEAQVYRACEPPVARRALRERLRTPGVVAEAAIDAALAALEAWGVLLHTSGRLVALAVPGDVPKLRGLHEESHGWTTGLDEPFDVALERARERMRTLAAPPAMRAPLVVA